MRTLGFSIRDNSLYQQNLDAILWPFKGSDTYTPLLESHISDPHSIKTSSHAINTSIVNHQVSTGVTSDIISDGLFIADFVPSTVVIDRLGIGVLEGAGHHYFSSDKVVSFFLIDSTLPFTNLAKGRHLWYKENQTSISLSLGNPKGDIQDTDYVRFHSISIINNANETLGNLSNLNGFTEVSPYVYEGYPGSISLNASFSWGVSYSPDTRKFTLDPDVLAPDGFIDESAISSNTYVVNMLTHMADTELHPGSWTTPVLSDSTTVSSQVIHSLYENQTIRYTPASGDWYVTSEGESMSYKEDLTDPVAHWLAISMGDPDALVTDPDDNNIVLGECVNGTDQMRCYFTLADGKLPVATPGVILRRCNPGRGFTAKTLAEYAGP